MATRSYFPPFGRTLHSLAHIPHLIGFTHSESHAPQLYGFTTEGHPLLLRVGVGLEVGRNESLRRAKSVSADSSPRTLRFCCWHALMAFDIGSDFAFFSPPMTCSRNADLDMQLAGVLDLSFRPASTSLYHGRLTEACCGAPCYLVAPSACGGSPLKIAST